MIKVDAKAIAIGTGCTSTLANAYLELIVGAAIKFDINTIRRFAGWLANVGEESGALTASRENLNYTAQGLARTWPQRYALKPTAEHKIPNALALTLARNPEKIANNVYASRMGNGNEASGDGWKYRGVGWIQTTGKTNIQNALKALGLDINSDPSILEAPEYCALSAAYYWKWAGCNELLDKDSFSLSIKAVNGAMPNDANKGKERLAKYRACVAYLKTINKE